MIFPLVQMYRLEQMMPSPTPLTPHIPIQIEGWPGVHRQESLLGRAAVGTLRPEPIDDIDRLIESAHQTPAREPIAS